MADVLKDSFGCGVSLIFGGDEEKGEWNEIFRNTNMFALNKDEVQIRHREKLGSGAFCNVYPVHVRNGKTGQFNESLSTFALKELKLDIIEEPRLLKIAHADLLQEASVLRNLQHDNIVRLIGMADETSPRKDFFIITEKLAATLESKLKNWAKIRGPMRKTTPKDAVELRINYVATPIVSALGYLHSKRIIYRDLKPGNVGFDTNGKVKMFDFGLALEVPEGELIKGQAGTVRYMAPEMRSKKDFPRGKPYTFPVDVYSFAIMLWEIITSRIPFEKQIPTTAIMAPKEELSEDKRPNLKYVECKELALLLEACWATEPSERWNFDRIVQELQKIGSDLASNNGTNTKRPSPAKRAFISSMNNY